MPKRPQRLRFIRMRGRPNRGGPNALEAECDRLQHFAKLLRALLFDLVAARLAMASVISAWRAARHPENRAYIAGDDGLVGALLERLPALEDGLRAAFGACGATSGPRDRTRTS